MAERATVTSRSEKSAEAVLVGMKPMKGRTRRSVRRQDDAKGMASDVRFDGAVWKAAG
jgi:hypothetical protein